MKHHVVAKSVLIALAVTLGAATHSPYTTRDKAYYAAQDVVNFVRPGLVITVNSAKIDPNGTITAVYTVTDPKGLPLDIAGVSTPGAITLSYVAAVLPNGQTQYTSYSTRSRTGAAVGTITVAGPDSGGTRTQLGSGQYQYVFATKASAGFDAGATHTIGVYGNRNLTEFNFGISYASTVYNFVPNGSPVTRTRDVVKTESCNNCHDQLAAHGGSRRVVELCVLCHTPQSVDSATGNSVDFKVFVHKIHMGSQLPSVLAKTPYQIGSSDYSDIVFPANPRRCETCHQQNTGAAQATAYLTNPSAAACGSCHDDVNFATGVNHAGGPQIDDKLCANCHIPQGEIDFDASIKGAHVVPTESAMLSGINLTLVGVAGGTKGNVPTVTFTVKDNSGAAIPLSKLGFLQLTMAGPTSDYGYSSFGSDVTTPGYVTESAIAAPCTGDGTCSYTFKHAVPANASGTFAVGIESRRAETLLPGTTKQQVVQYGAKNQVAYFSVDGSAVTPRRDVVATASCNNCHSALSVHGTLRNQTEYCVLCHNPSNTDASVRVVATNPDDKAAPPQGVNFNLLVHRIHDGAHQVADGRTYTVVGFGGSHNDFSDITFPAMSPNSQTGDLTNCSMCHVNGSEQNLPSGKNAVVDPQGPLNPVQPITSACTGCHTSLPAASHALSNTTTLGEACASCHGPADDFGVAKVHARP